MFFFLCVCECSPTYAKSVQPNLFKVSANEASIRGKRKHPLWSSKPLLRPWRPPGPSCIQPALIIPRSRYFSLSCINQRLELIDDGFSAMAESQLLPFFIRRPWPKCIFSHFVAFGRGRNAVFTVFRVSSVADEQFSAFSTRRLQAKRCFSHFLHFAHER